MGRPSLWVLLGLTFLAVSLYDVQVSAEVGPTESECRPYIEKAIHSLKAGEEGSAGEESTEGVDSQEKGVVKDNDDDGNDTGEDGTSKEDTTPSDSKEAPDDDDDAVDSKENADAVVNDESEEKKDDDDDQKSGEVTDEKEKADDDDDDTDDDKKPGDADDDDDDDDDDKKSKEATDKASGEEKADNDDDDDDKKSGEEDDKDGDGDDDEVSAEKGKEDDAGDSAEPVTDSGEEKDKENDQSAEEADSKKDDGSEEQATEEAPESGEDNKDDDNDDDDDDKEKSKETTADDDDDGSKEEVQETVQSRGKRELESEPAKDKDSKENDDDDDDDDKKESEEDEKTKNAQKSAEDDEASKENKADDDDDDDDDDDNKKDDKNAKDDDDDDDEEGDSEETRPEDDLLLEGEIPENLRDRSHITELLHLDDEHEAKENAIDRVAEIILRDLKRIYESAIKPLETLYKYRDLSNRHFGDPEIFSKPLILFMGPWSGGKSTIINYLTGNEYTVNSLRTGAEPSPAYFNILMHGKEPEVLDGTQLAADWTFSGLQKFGQGLEDRLRGLKLPNKLLEKVNIVEIPGILEVRKQVSRLFPFNDACQWFIDRADIIFLVYDPAKLDVGPETEAILDQLKGREYQTRIVLNKADQVKPEELLRVQGALIWNISPLMSSAQPPVMYTTSLWSHPYETSSPIRLLQAQERAFLRDIRTAIDKRIENKISSARRFAVRVRNHAKMVDCYLTTYYNHKTLFGNKKRISDQIIENPQNYHIYEGLSTLTNISRYDLPDPEVYRDFFRLNPLFEFKKLSETCTYFRGCPINKLDVAIAYDLPELVGKYKKMAEEALNALDNDSNKKSKS